MTPQTDLPPEVLDSAGLDREAEASVRLIGIPPCPAVLTDLMREMREEEPDFRRIGALISRDVGLAATTVKTANSPFFGLRRPAGTVQDALNYLGVRTVAGLVTGLLLKQAFPIAESAAMARFWEMSASLAELTARIARELRAADPGTAYTFGLFRDCGMPIMLRKYPDYALVMAASGRQALELEARSYPTNHARIGLLLVQNWLLPEALCAAVLHHHGADALRGARAGLDPQSMRLAACAALADHLDASADRLAPHAADEPVLLACAQLGLAPEALDALLEAEVT